MFKRHLNNYFKGLKKIHYLSNMHDVPLPTEGLIWVIDASVLLFLMVKMKTGSCLVVSILL
jgi:hypothetical protein